jgi:hypothetical protein
VMASCATVTTTRPANIQKAGPEGHRGEVGDLHEATAQPMAKTSAMDQGRRRSAQRKARAASGAGGRSKTTGPRV